MIDSTHSFKVLQGVLELAQRHVGLRASIISLNILGVQLNRICSVSQRVTETLQFQVCETPISIQDSARFQFNSFAVQLHGSIVVLFWNSEDCLLPSNRVGSASFSLVFITHRLRFPRLQHFCALGSLNLTESG